MVGSLLRAALAEFEIEVDGSIRIDTRPPSTPPWIEFPSVPLANVIESMNRYSSNFIANQLALAVHRERTWGIGSEGVADDGSRSTGETSVPPTSRGASSVRSAGEHDLAAPPAPLRLADAGGSLVGWLSETLPEASRGCALFDGSGLSTDNRLTAGLLTALLVRSWDDLRFQPKLVASLPGPGEPGTLRSRFRNSARPVLWAKTGTLSDTPVSSLAGFFEDEAGRAVAFSILLNADAGSLWGVPALQSLQEHWIEVYRK
jgi:D-alanyl-D-alanine carboxypeptidase